MQNIRVILADDHAVVRAGIRKTIEQISNLEVVAEVGTGPLVFNSLINEQVDLLLIDITMPEFDPIQAIKKIKILYPNLKILVISAYDDEFYVKGLLNAGVNGYHMKDQSLNELKLAITRVLEGETWISSSLIKKLSANNSEKTNLPELTKREHELLFSLRQGLDNKSIAKKHFFSVKTIENNLSCLYKKLKVQRTALVMEGMGINHAHLKLYPLHGLDKKFKEMIALKKVFFENYPGYLTTQIGPQPDPEELKKLAGEIKE